MAGQCFYGFADVEVNDDAGEADFGAFLPNHAIDAVGAWMEARNAADKVCIAMDHCKLTIVFCWQPKYIIFLLQNVITFLWA